MPETGRCPGCGAALPPDAPKGICPRCLYRLGFEEGPEAQAESVEAPSTFEAAADLAGLRQFGDYELLEEIGQGGMGVVYRARQKSLNRMVALKMLLFGPHAPPESVKRFRAEAVATAALQHPNIVAIHEVGFCEGQHFIAMDFVEGQPMSVLFRGGPLPARRAAGYLKTIAEAIHYAHERGILHRDLKPANILIDTNDHPRVTDFGLAKRLDESRLAPLDSELTVTGQVLGSPNYMPPEQATGKRGAVGRRTDVYALGAILYHALTGRPPFIGEGMADTVQQVLNVEPVSPRVLNPGVPADLETVCLKCLEKEPPKRYATAQMLAEELGRYLDRKPVLARPVGRLAKGWRWCRRNPVQASLIAALVTAIVGGFAGVLGQLHRARVAELAAQKHAYVAEMNLARQALEESNLGRARTLLERYWPARQGSRNQKLEIDLRGWEWRWLWQSSQTHERTTLAGASNRVHAVALSPDCRWLVALSARDALRVWELASRRCVAALPDASYYNDHILLAPDGERLFVGGYETASVRIWRVPSLEPAGELRHGSPVNWIALSLDGRLLAASDSTGVKIWDTIDLRELAAIPSERNLRFGRVALSRDGRRVAFSDYDGRLYVWDWAARRPLAELAGHTRPPIWQAAVQDLAFTPDGTRLLSAGSDRTVRVWELAPGRESGQLPGLREVVTSLAFSPDGAALATTSCDQTVRLWDVATWQHRAILRGHLDEVWDVTFSADGNTLATAGKDQTVKLWEAHPPPERVFSWPVPAGNWVAVVAPEARAIGLTAADGSFRLVDTTTWQEALARSLVIRPSNGGAVAIDPRATCLVVSSEAGPLRTWRLPNGNASAEFLGHTGRVQVVAFSDDGDWLASAGADHTLRLWRTDTRQQMAQFPQEHERVTSLVFSPDANLLGVTFNDDELEIWERASGRRRVRFAPHKNTHEIAFFHRSPRFATGSSDGTVKIWNLRTQRLEALLRGSLRGVNNLAISPDDRRLATGTGEGVIKLWDLELRQEVAVLKGHPEGVTRLAFSRDGRTLLSASTDAVRVWEAPSLAEIEAAEKAKVSVQP